MIESGVMRSTEQHAVSWLREGRRFVQALLVEVEGSAPLPVGAMMAIDGEGAIEGSLTGGCVEGAVVTEAESLMAGERGPGVLTYGISDELAGTVGLMCGGTVHIFIQELSGEVAAIELGVLEAHGRRADGGDRDVARRRSGGHAAVGERRRRVVGSLGRQPLLDRNVAREAAGLLQEGKTTIRRFGSDGATLGRRPARPHSRLRAAAADVDLRRDRFLGGARPVRLSDRLPASGSATRVTDSLARRASRRSPR